MTDPHDALREDDLLGPLVAEHGELELDPWEDTFQRLVVSILRQQVSMASAAAIRERLFENFEVTPEGIVAADPEALQDVGLSGQKADYVQHIADAYLEEGYDREYFAALSDEDVVAELTDIHGVGEWTAEMFLMFALGREDVFPVGDLGIRKGMQELMDATANADAPTDPTRAEMRSFAERWRPHRSYASLYVWRAYEG
ncbi:DNA-3-methyladenine glycosylase family protein [Halobacterium zhouii]|uniref:DNA-3-methyladenine glycosylase family protein n=1 Tax=Halobacterium zhouii TaxID=2902624 RepID=UPI001E4ADFF4|nr:DNA-3-methyladenine glycosylase [Halobacterium zhouii]